MLSSFSAVAMAQTPLDSPEPGAREEAGRMVDAYVLSNLQESLGLSDDQFVRLLPLVKRLQAERREAIERRIARASGDATPLEIGRAPPSPRSSRGSRS